MKNTKKYKNLIILFALVLICTSLVLSAGCSNYGESFYSKASYDSARNEIYADSADYEYGNYVNEAEMLDISGNTGYSYDMLAAGDASAASVLPADRKIIRNANITMEVADVEQAYDNILALLKNFGGYEANREMQSDISRYYDYRGYSTTPTVSATLKVPANKLDTFLTDIKKEGETIYSTISSNDITDQYFDSKIRITTLEKTLDNYYEFLENAKDVDEQLRVTRYINDITQEIEQLKGSIKRWDSLVDYSTVTLYLYKPYEAPIPEPEPRVINWNSLSLEDMGWLISSGFLGICNAIFNVIQWIIITILVISPIVIPAVIILVVLIRRHKKRKLQPQNNNSNNSVENK